MNRFFIAAAAALLIAAPALAQTASPQPPAAQTQMGEKHRAGERHEHAERSAHHREHRAAGRMRDGSCPTDSTDEAGNLSHPGSYCLPGGRS